MQLLLDRIKSPKNRDRINFGIENEKRIRLHTVGTQDFSTSYDEWLIKIKKLLPSDKFNIFEQLIGNPVPTLDLTESIFDELAKIFEASNRSIHQSYSGEDSRQKTNKFNAYFDHEHFFKSEVYDMLKVAPNSVLVVDTKLETDKDGLAQPTVYFVHLESIIDLDVNRDGSTNYILFKVDKNTIVGIDKESYYVFDKDSVLKSGYPSPHNLTDELGRPYCPAFLMYPDFLNVTDNVMVNSPLTKSLGNLDWLLFWAVSKRYLDLYAPFPIYVSYEQDCSFVLPTGESCDNGFISVMDLESSTKTIPCPHCSKTKIHGAGSEITVPAPQSKEDPNLIDAIKVIPAEEKSITYVTSEKQRLEQEIFYSVLGKTSSPIENFSQSTTQLDLSTESRKAVLIHIKSIFEKVHKKVLYTMNKIMFQDSFIGCSVNYGDNYFLTTQEQEAERYKKLKDTGAPESMLHASLEAIITTTYRTSPHIALLQQLYLEVEPYQTMSNEDVMKLSAQRMISRKAAIAKIHFTDFIEMYESEHEVLVTMVQAGVGQKQVLAQQIKKQLMDFADIKMKEIDAEEPVEEINHVTTPDMTKPSSREKATDREEAGNIY